MRTEYQKNRNKHRLSKMIWLALIMAIATDSFGAQENQTEADFITITPENLVEHIHALRSLPAKSYTLQGKIVLNESTGAHEVWYANNLKFLENSTIFIGHKDLTLNVRGKLSFAGDNPLLIASFPADDRKASNGGDGGNGGAGQHGSGSGADGATGGVGGKGFPGVDGLKSGSVNLVLSKPPPRPFQIALIGQDGGDGGDGGNGGRGGNGQRGRTAKSGPFDCKRGGGNGGDGGNGGRGGGGGPGGRCGAGGQMMVFGPPATVEAVRGLLDYPRTLASSGNPGEPGVGGPGGGGGGMGRGSGHCRGGRGGSSGSQGAGGSKPGTQEAPCQTPQVQFHPVVF